MVVKESVADEDPYFGIFNGGWLLYLLDLGDWVCTRQ